MALMAGKGVQGMRGRVGIERAMRGKERGQEKGKEGRRVSS